jgi:hypothetical protein
VTRALVVVLVLAVLAGCGGDDPKQPKAATAPAAQPDDPAVRVALAAVQVADPKNCARFYEGAQGVELCQDYITGGSLQAQAQPRTVERTGNKAVVTLAAPGGNPVALLVRQAGGKWRVYDSPDLLPEAD